MLLYAIEVATTRHCNKSNITGQLLLKYFGTKDSVPDGLATRDIINNPLQII